MEYIDIEKMTPSEFDKIMFDVEDLDDDRTKSQKMMRLWVKILL